MKVDENKTVAMLLKMKEKRLSFKKPRLFFIGMWHLGCVTAAGMHKLGFPVTCFDFDGKVIDGLSNGTIPVYENGLKELFTDDIKFTKKISDCSDCDYIFITYDVDATGVDTTNARMNCDPLLRKLIKELKPYAKGKILVVRSQITLGFCDALGRELDCEVCCVPENLRLGTAVENFFHPDWMVFGISSDAIRGNISLLFEDIDTTNRLFTGLREAEMVKLTMNCYLATMISFSSEISDLCEIHDVDASMVLQAIKMDKRVSRYAPITPGLGFSGGTIKRDVIAAIKFGPTPLLDAVMTINEKRSEYIKNKLKQLLGNDLTGKTITFFGAAYKSGTDTLRDSPTVREILSLQREGKIFINVYDPLITTGIPGVRFLNYVSDAKDSDAIVIMTDSNDWKNINYSLINPKVIIDTKGVLPNTVKHFGIGVKNE